MSGTIRYTIRPYDTLWMLAQVFNTTVDSIMQLNPGIDPRNLQIGQVVTLMPGYQYYPSYTGEMPLPGETSEMPSPEETGELTMPGTPGGMPMPGTPGGMPMPGTPGGMPMPGTTGRTPMPGTTGRTPMPGTTGGAPMPGTTGGAPMPGTTGGAPMPGTTGRTPMPGTTGGAPMPGTTGGAPMPGTTGGAPMPGTTGGMPMPGTTGGAPMPGTTGGMPMPGTTGGAPMPGTTGGTPMSEMTDGVEEDELDNDMMDADMLQCELVNYFRMLWEQHITWTRMAVVAIANNLPETDLILQRLLRNPVDFANALRTFYGDEAAQTFEDLLTGHLTIAAELVQAAKAGNTNAAADAEQRWFENASQIAEFLGTLNPYWSVEDWNAMMNEHLELLRENATALLSRNYEESISGYDDIEAQALEMADMMAEGIARQFPY